MDDDTINVPIRVRSNEVAQLHEFVPEAIDQCRRTEMDDEADQLQCVVDEYLEPNDGYISMPADEWRAVIRNVHRRTDNGLRSEYLQRKLLKRLRARMEELE
jgi:hypothetical protein